ncbi:MAG: hypothetical protein M1821_007715 [Bathelium mastoideum]|nr:MAG: hypothetical protein M1821_007715 [Bathelium mastoideum]
MAHNGTNGTLPEPDPNSRPGVGTAVNAAAGQIKSAVQTHRATDGTHQPALNAMDGAANEPQSNSYPHELQVLSGPLLNYKHTSNATSNNPTWHGSVLIVTKYPQPSPELYLRDLVRPGANIIRGAGKSRRFAGERLYTDNNKTFWRLRINVPFGEHESAWEYTIPNIRFLEGDGEKKTATRTFYVPSKKQSMRIMFHSCNGFSVGTDIPAFGGGPVVWNDVLRFHAEKPIHVMIGGGDQIYNDGVRVDGPLRAWTDIGNPHKRRNFPFNEDLRRACDDYYFNNYVRWYNTEPFATANCQIPQVNIWDDHDIIDGFGSYTDHFMRCAVFRGIGGVAHKYYMLFQHHVPPPKTTFTTDAPGVTHTPGTNGVAADPHQEKETYVMAETDEDPSFVFGGRPGPYVEERSRSVYCQLGAHIAFLGIDARTERTRHQINYTDTYDKVFARVSAELSANKNLKHFILLLGVPIAYPRLQWLENILQSPIIGPIRFLNKRFGVAGGFFNHFDGNVDLLDDLDDHYTAHQHKKERRDLVHRLQTLAREHSVRVSILGGDVHLAALGRFYSKPHLAIPAEHDFRYMPNLVSSAITNKPPPQAVANLLARRNKVHHLDDSTDETLMYFFDRDPGDGEAGVARKTADANHCTMPSRNYAIIDESHRFDAGAEEAEEEDGVGMDGMANGATVDGVNGNGTKSTNPRTALHTGEEHSGTQHPAASGLKRTRLGGRYGLDVTIRVEVKSNDPSGRTEGYGMTIPGLEVQSS